VWATEQGELEMMRFDLTCNIALCVEQQESVRAHVLPALTAQQRLLNEVIWVKGCERWMVSVLPDGERVLDLTACDSEVHVAFAASLEVAPVWCHVSALWDLSGIGLMPPSDLTRPASAFTRPPSAVARPTAAYTQPSGHWSAERIVAAFGSALPSPAAVFAALPEVFEWLHNCVDADQFRSYAGVPAETMSCAAPCIFDRLEFAIAVFRSLGVPARPVAGFAPEAVRRGPHDARAFALELYWDGRWWLFEPDGQVPAFGFIRTAIACESTDLVLLDGGASRVLRMDVNVDPPPAWGLPLRSSSRLLLSLAGRDVGGAQDTTDVDTVDVHDAGSPLSAADPTAARARVAQATPP
jgi:hypothetical protein